MKALRVSLYTLAAALLTVLVLVGGVVAYCKWLGFVGFCWIGGWVLLGFFILIY